MLVLVSYDVASDDLYAARRLRRVAKICGEYGQRVQYSMFECLVDPKDYAMMKSRLLHEIDSKKDSLRFYNLGKTWEGRIEHFGAKEAYNPEGPLVI